MVPMPKSILLLGIFTRPTLASTLKRSRHMTFGFGTFPER